MRQPNAGDYNNPNCSEMHRVYLMVYQLCRQKEITNPLHMQQTVTGNYNYATNLLGSAFIEVEPIAGLKIRSQISAKQAYYGSDSFTPLYYLNSSTSNQSTHLNNCKQQKPVLELR
jgi:hypothetical protein